jgi:hypothetical protein
MLHMSGVQDGFCLRDLTKPDRSRIQKHLSAIINLYKFKESVEEEHQPLVDHTVRCRGFVYSREFALLAHCLPYDRYLNVSSNSRSRVPSLTTCARSFRCGCKMLGALILFISCRAAFLPKISIFCSIDHDAAAPALTAAEAAISALAQESDDLTSRAEKLKAVGNEQREATREMIEQLVSSYHVV